MDFSHRACQVVAGYEVGGVIGIGTYGEVRVAKDLSTGRRVAIKIVDLSRFEADTQMMMAKEIEILKSIDHVNCIRILDVKDKVPYRGSWCSVCACSEYQPLLGSPECMGCTHEGSEHCSTGTRQVMLLVQELAVGGELCGLLMHSGPFLEEIARYYFRQLLDGLEYCHGRGVVHRDLKPENLVLDGNFQLKIVDFGLAAKVHEDMGGVFHTGVGSAPYSAPEVYYSKDVYGGQPYRGEPADLWSCAVILFVMLTARPPFLRPLNETYGPSLKRDKYFVNLLRGQGYDKMSLQAKSMLSKIFQINPRDRITLAQLKQEEWMRGPVPPHPELCRIMEEKAQSVWMTQQKPQMVELLAKHRHELLFTPTFAPTPVPLSAGVFADADTNISLLSLHESESEVVYRCLTIPQPAEESWRDFAPGAGMVRSHKQGLFSGCMAPNYTGLRLRDADDEAALRAKIGLPSHHELDAKDQARDSVPVLASSNSFAQRKKLRSREEPSAGDRGGSNHDNAELLPFHGPGTGIATIRSPFSPGSLGGVARYSRLLCPLSLSEVRARVVSTLKNLGLTHSASEKAPAMTVNGDVYGFQISGIIRLQELEVALGPGGLGRDRLSFVDCQRLTGDPIAFYHVFSSMTQSLAC